MRASFPLEAPFWKWRRAPGSCPLNSPKRGFAMMGLDIGRTFVELARKNAEKSGVHVRFEHGNAAETPFADQSFDFLCAAPLSRILPIPEERSEKCVASSNLAGAV
jgi:hypothetical protein